MWVDEVFRGVRKEKPYNLVSATYKCDYHLIPKDEEHKYTSLPVEDTATMRNKNVVPQYLEYPPLLALIRAKEKGEAQPKLKTRYVQSPEDLPWRIAEDGEEPTMKFAPNMGLGKPVSPNLYKGTGVELDDKNEYR